MSAPIDGFEAVNPEWRYLIQPPDPESLIEFTPNPGDAWLATNQRPGTDLRILSSAVVVKLLNQALFAGYPVIAEKMSTGQVLAFLTPVKPEPQQPQQPHNTPTP